jgi:hypothetical protein
MSVCVYICWSVRLHVFMCPPFHLLSQLIDFRESLFARCAFRGPPVIILFYFYFNIFVNVYMTDTKDGGYLFDIYLFSQYSMATLWMMGL